MSVWTHFAAVIRFDSLRVPGLEYMELGPDLGKTCDWGDDQKVWEACNVPCGSEGSIQYQIWENPHQSSLAAYTAMIWGDLRDYEDRDELVAYLNRVTEGKMIRAGIAEIHTEYQKTLVYRYSSENEEWTNIYEDPHPGIISPNETQG